MLLNATPFAFVIDLACLASRRGYLKLDKWLSDKIREHQVNYFVLTLASDSLIYNKVFCQSHLLQKSNSLSWAIFLQFEG